MQFLHLVFFLGSLFIVSGNVFSAPITVFPDRSTFEAATGPGFTVDDFGTTVAGGFSELNASTNLGTGDLSVGGPILPGTVAAGATYSAPVGVSNHPNGPMSLDVDILAEGYDQGFLHALNSPPNDPPISITVTFDNPVSGFGFDSTSYFTGAGFDIEIMFQVGNNFNDHITFANFPDDSTRVLSFSDFLAMRQIFFR